MVFEDPIATRMYRGYELGVFPDPDPSSPREDSNPEFLVFSPRAAGGRYTLDDKGHTWGREWDAEMVWDQLQSEYPEAHIFGLEAHDTPRGARIRNVGLLEAGDKSLPWVQVNGFAVVTKELAEQTIGTEYFNDPEKVKSAVEQDLQVYNDYLWGDVYMVAYRHPGGKWQGSIGGYYLDHQKKGGHEYDELFSELRGELSSEPRGSQAAALEAHEMAVAAVARADQLAKKAGISSNLCPTCRLNYKPGVRYVVEGQGKFPGVETSSAGKSPITNAVKGGIGALLSGKVNSIPIRGSDGTKLKVVLVKG